MTIALPHTDMRLAPTLGAWLAATAATPKSAIQDISHHGFTCLQLDATSVGLRPRQLDRRARRDLTAFLLRCGVQPAGIDLFIPRRDWTESDRVDRAAAAALAAVELAADLGRLPLSLALPAKDIAPEVAAALVEAADGHGVRLVIHAEDQLDTAITWIERLDLPCLSLGFDPAALLAHGEDPVRLTQRHARRLGVARLSDWGQRGGRGDGRRTPVGVGDLDVLAYRLSLDLPTGRSGPVVLDLHDLPDPVGAAAQSARAWAQAAPLMPG